MLKGHVYQLLIKCTYKVTINHSFHFISVLMATTNYNTPQSSYPACMFTVANVFLKQHGLMKYGTVTLHVKFTRTEILRYFLYATQSTFTPRNCCRNRSCIALKCVPYIESYFLVDIIFLAVYRTQWNTWSICIQ